MKEELLANLFRVRIGSQHWVCSFPRLWDILKVYLFDHIWNQIREETK